MRGALFDLDGTVVDSRADLARGVNLLLDELGMAPLPEDVVVGFVGNGARTLVRRALDAADPEGLVPRDDATLRRFLACYDRVLLATTRPFPGAPEALARLRARGIGLALVTNKPLAPTRRILAGLGLDEAFDVVLGGDSLPERKPSPAPLLAAAGALGVEPSASVFVGDSDVDAAAAGAARMPFVWCSFGRIHPDRPHGAALVAGDFAAVEALVLDALSPAP